MQLAAADIGNSSLKIAISEENPSQLPLHKRELLNWRHRLAHATGLAPPDWLMELPETNWVISSVNTAGQTLLLNWIQSSRPNDRVAVLEHADIPLPSNVLNRESVGIDRLVAAWLAQQTYPDQSVIVIDAGTAVTIDLIDNQTFQGGLIYSGAETMLRHLSGSTDALPDLADRSALLKLGDWQNEIIGKSTEEAILRGTYQLQVGGLIHAVEEIESRSFGLVNIIAGGGGIEDLRPGLPNHWSFVQELVIRGALGIGELLEQSRFHSIADQRSSGA